MTSSSNDLTRQQLEELDALLQRMLAVPASQPDIRKADARKPEERKPQEHKPDARKPQVVETPVVESWRIDRPEAIPTPKLHLALPEIALPEIPKPEPITEAPAPRTAIPALTSSEPPIALTVPLPSFAERSEPREPHVVPREPREPHESLAGVPVTPSIPFQPTVPEQPAEPAPRLINRLDPIPLTSFPPPHFATETGHAFAPEKSQSNPSLSPLLWPVLAVNWIAEELLKSLGAEVLLRPAAKWTMAGLGVLMIAAAAVWTLQGFGWITLPLK